MIASPIEENDEPSPLAPLVSRVKKNKPMIMSWVGIVTGRPSEGFKMLFVDSIKMRASA